MTLSVSVQHAFPDFALDATFDAPAGVTALFGRSGSGKTTLVNAVAGLLKPDQGRVTLGDQTLMDTGVGHFLPAHRRRIGYVFQDGRLFPHLSVSQNLHYGQRWSKSQIKPADAQRIVEMLGIGPLLNRRPESLSGGEKQRVALGRALLSSPELLLMDEPLAALDDARKDEILPYLERLRDETDIPTLYVSHSVAEVARLATTVVILTDGRVTSAGPAEHVMSDPHLAPLFGLREAGAILTAEIVRHHDDGLTELRASGGTLFLPTLSAQTGATVRVRVLAQDVMLAREKPSGLSALNIFSGTITSLKEGKDAGVIARVQVGQDHILARVTQRSARVLALRVGADCHAIIKSVSIAKGSIGGQASVT
ncbi:molybdenum ABC transporter ATP-binding protein [Aliiroseovarius sp. YM-037]|uniref:molybdenum ABC transporter ATP-binding protein n=1 Tax=Aliiroseovarius sp. YM-037 TaxID=3341728 RepID=UPI003A7FFDCD